MHLLSVFVSWLTLAIGGTAYHNGAINNFEFEFALKYFFLSIYAFSGHSIFKICNSEEEFSVGLLIHFLPKFCHTYFPLIFLNAIPVTFWAFKPDMFAWYLIQIVCFDTLTLLSSWFFVIYLLLNGKTLGGNEWVFL